MLLPGVQNSMACCLRRAGRLRAAESMLQKAAAAVKGKGYPASVRGNTYLNLCAVLSSQGKHKGALDAAKQVRATLHNAMRTQQHSSLLAPRCCVSALADIGCCFVCASAGLGLPAQGSDSTLAQRGEPER
jgi:hypothetical protein